MSFTLLNGKGGILKNKIIGSLVAVLILVGLALGMVGCGNKTGAPLLPQERLRVATTTSLYDTGLWGYLEPMFEQQYNIELDVM